MKLIKLKPYNPKLLKLIYCPTLLLFSNRRFFAIVKLLNPTCLGEDAYYLPLKPHLEQKINNQYKQI